MTPFVTLPGVFTPDECARLVALAGQGSPRDAGLRGGATVPELRRAEIVWLEDIDAGAWVMERLVRVTAQANREAFGFDLTDFAESAQIARYGAERQGHFDWHADIGAAALAARRKLTLVVQLSGPAGYTGGVLELRPGTHLQEAPQAQGTATVFPSFVLHRVTPVTSGTRWSLTLWAHGPAFR